MIKELIIKKGFDEAYSFLKKLVLDKEGVLKVSEKDLETSISYHLQFVLNWSKDVSFRELPEAKPLEYIYVDLDYYLTPKRLQYLPEEDKKIRLRDIFSNLNRHIVILGQPGAGKTTSMKYLSTLVIFDETFCPNDFNFPIVIRLRDLCADEFITKSEINIFKHIYKTLGLYIDFSNNAKVDPEIAENIIQKIVLQFLDKLKVLLILDGYDEVEQYDHKSIILEQVRRLCLSLSNSKVVLTSRSGDFHYDIDNTVVYEICPLTDEQIFEFCSKWLQSDEKAKIVKAEIDNSPFSDTTIRPLTLAHLCTIYNKYGYIPPKPKSVYKKVVNLLIEDWDLQRSIKRMSKYSDFEPDRKFEFLSTLAFYLTTVNQTSVFAKQDLADTYKQIAPNFLLPINEVRQVIDELEGHSGLIQQTGQNTYEFAHKSIQEYLSAEYIVKLPSIPESKKLLLTIPNELALAVAISSNPTIYFSLLIFKHFERELILDERFIETFLLRIIAEKPDFSNHPILGVAVLYIFTLYQQKLSTSSGKSKEIKNALSKVLEVIKFLISNETVLYSIGSLKKYYDENKVNKSTENHDISTLKMVEAVSNIPEKMQPEYLLVSSDIWASS